MYYIKIPTVRFMDLVRSNPHIVIYKYIDCIYDDLYKQSCFFTRDQEGRPQTGQTRVSLLH